MIAVEWNYAVDPVEFAAAVIVGAVAAVVAAVDDAAVADGAVRITAEGSCEPEPQGKPVEDVAVAVACVYCVAVFVASQASVPGPLHLGAAGQSVTEQFSEVISICSS